MSERFDVVVVGAGPVGLLAAVELTLGGARVLVLERLAGVNPTMKALGVGPLGSETLQRRGLGSALAAAEARTLAAAEPTAVALRSRGSNVSGHFGGLFLLRRDVQAEPERRMRIVAQQTLETLLGERAQALGIAVRRGCEVTGFEERPDGIDVDWTSPDGAGHARCGWLVGCDGGRSGIRKRAGFAFPGTPPTLTMYQAKVEIDRPDLLLPAGWHRTSGGVFSFGAFAGRLIMLDFSGPPADRDAPVTRQEIETALRRVSGQDVRVTALDVANRWTDNTRLVDTYRRGRVLLAGDAAHIHSPFGGQGLSLGLVDAANLGWKLAAVVRGDMPESLLDTYTAERRPVAEAVLANTLAQVAIMRPDPQSGAMRDILAKLLGCDDANRLLGGMMNGLATRYDHGSDRDEVGRLIGDRPLGPEGRTLYEALEDGYGVLLDASPASETSRFVETRARRLRCVPVETGPSLLIRPDACVAWAGDGRDNDGLAEALGRWFPAAG